MNSVLWTQVNQQTGVKWMATGLVAANKEADRQAERLTGRQKNMKENKE